MGKRTKSISTLFLVVVFASGPLICYFGYGPIAKALAALKTMGIPGIFLFSGFFILGTLLFFPLSLLAFAGGLLYGLAGGLAIGLTAATAGACLGFLISRYVCREWIHHKLSQRGKFRTFCERVKKNDWKITLLTRLSLFFPFTGANYAFGLTDISFTRYSIMTFLGLIPDMLLYVYLGTISGSIVAYFRGGKTFSPAETTVMAFAALASVVLIIFAFFLTKNLKGEPATARDCASIKK